MTTIAVILSGCGVKDGSEIHEATLALYFLDKLGATVKCFAPNRAQAHVVNHHNDQADDTSNRNILQEAARIARGEIAALDTLDVSQFDAIIFPGGFGAAKNLCDYAFKGADFSVQPDIASLITQAHQQKITMGFLCIAPMLAAKLIPGVTVTVGQAGDTAEHITQLGGIHQVAKVSEVVWDEKNKVASTPAYMLGPSISAIGTGIEALCQSVVQHATTTS